MPLSADIMRFLLLLSMLGEALLAAFYLRRRQLRFTAYLRWGLLALMLPLVGPFLILLHRPGDAGDGERRFLR